jgi:hypothetical protein
VPRRVLLACWIALALCLPLAAHATSLPVVGSLSIQFLFGPPRVPFVQLPPVTVSGTGVAVVNGSGGGAHLDTLALPADLFQATKVRVPAVSPTDLPVYGVQLTGGNQAGSFAAGTGTIPLKGIAKVCLFFPCSTTVGNIVVPLSVVGAGGTQFVHAVAVAAEATVIGAPWTTGTVSIGTITRMGGAAGPDGMTGSTAQASGHIQLVSPVFLSTEFGALSPMPAFATMSLHFVPEPASFALIGAGLLALGAAGRRRMR